MFLFYCPGISWLCLPPSNRQEWRQTLIHGALIQKHKQITNDGGPGEGRGSLFKGLAKEESNLLFHNLRYQRGSQFGVCPCSLKHGSHKRPFALKRKPKNLPLLTYPILKGWVSLVSQWIPSPSEPPGLLLQEALSGVFVVYVCSTAHHGHPVHSTKAFWSSFWQGGNVPQSFSRALFIIDGSSLCYTPHAICQWNIMVKAKKIVYLFLHSLPFHQTIKESCICTKYVS